jgi:RNA-directed DNA polymerase
MTTTDKLKKKKLRHLEYYSLQKDFDNLYEKSKQGKQFDNLMNLILCENNIMLAFRNLKKNKGSKTPGVDGKNIKIIEMKTPEELVRMVGEIFKDYKPSPVRRVWIDKPGKAEKRPLGIPTIEERICQQCFLQVLEPIMEAKFHNHSYGFRPNRSTKNAIRRFKHLVFVSKLHYVIDIDVKGFFDNVNHNKLLKQLWTLGIRDKQTLSIINKMLKAEIEGEGIPICGVPQGGICSPILSNVVLNELDYWVSSQWETFKSTNKYKAKGSMHSVLKQSKLKEMWIVRYCDDFKILCRNHKDAQKTYIAVKNWLKERLGLEINHAKSGIVNLRRRHSEFLGLKIKVVKSKNSFVTRSDMTDKAKAKITSELKKQIINIRKHPSKEKINLLNSQILGIQNYYSMATLINLSLGKINYRFNRTINKSLKRIITTRGSPNKLYTSLYGNYNRKIYYIYGIPIFYLGGIKFKPPPIFNPKICNYTEMGREEIHQKLTFVDTKIIRYLMENPDNKRSAEYNDNRISLYSSQLGKCAITGTKLEIDEMVCYNKLPINKGGTDYFNNLIYISQIAESLIKEKDSSKYEELKTFLNLNKNQLAKVEKLRALAEN